MPGPRSETSGVLRHVTYHVGLEMVSANVAWQSSEGGERGEDIGPIAQTDLQTLATAAGKNTWGDEEVCTHLTQRFNVPVSAYAPPAVGAPPDDE